MLKQVIVVRRDLKMSTGKTAAQVAHASLSAYEKCKQKYMEWASSWIKEGQEKIVCEVESLEELMKLVRKVEELGISYHVVVDKGLTELPPNTVTCVGFGPAPEKLINRVTGHLKLLR